MLPSVCREVVGGAYRDGVRGASVDVQGGGVVVGDSSSGQRGWGGEADRVAAVWEACNAASTSTSVWGHFAHCLTEDPLLRELKSNVWRKQARSVKRNTNFDLTIVSLQPFVCGCNLHYSPSDLQKTIIQILSFCRQNLDWNSAKQCKSRTVAH